MNTLTPTFFAINYPTATVARKKATPLLSATPLAVGDIEEIHTLQKIWQAYQEAQMSQGFWSALNRFLKLKCVQQRALQAQQRLMEVKQQLAQHPVSKKVLGQTANEATLSHSDYARLLGQLALSSTQQQFDYL